MHGKGPEFKSSDTYTTILDKLFSDDKIDDLGSDAGGGVEDSEVSETDKSDDTSESKSIILRAVTPTPTSPSSSSSPGSESVSDSPLLAACALGKGSDSLSSSVSSGSAVSLIRTLRLGDSDLDAEDCRTLIIKRF